MKKQYSTNLTTEKAAVLRQWLEDHKAKDISVLHLAGQHAFTECMLIASATSVRHAQSLAEGVAEACKEHNYEFLHIEGKQSGQWILLDLNDIVVNIFQESARDLYGLEQLWSRPNT